jgi:hypothetical protein
MVTGRLAADEGRSSAPLEHVVHAGHRAAARPHRSVQAERVHHRVGVEDPAAGGGDLAEPRQIARLVHTLERRQRRGGGLRHLRSRAFDGLADGVVARRLLGMRAGVVRAEELVHVTADTATL